MKTYSLVLFATIAVSLAFSFAGCSSAQNGTPNTTSPAQSASHDGNDKQQTAHLAKLSNEDRSLAEAQGYCAVTAEPLGSMGTPLKLIVNEQPVFVCCKGCEKKAKSNPDKTLAKVAELKTKVQAEGHH